MPAGIMWGRRVLSPGIPFTGGRTPEQARKMMVIMTDGQNSMYKHGQSHNAGDCDGADKAEKLDQTNEDTSTLCRLAKAEGTEIFSIAFEVDDTVTKNMLEGCASERSMFFDAANSNQLEKAFKEIGAKLEGSEDSVRLSR